MLSIRPDKSDERKRRKARVGSKTPCYSDLFFDILFQFFVCPIFFLFCFYDTFSNNNFDDNW